MNRPAPLGLGLAIFVSVFAPASLGALTACGGVDPPTQTPPASTSTSPPVATPVTTASAPPAPTASADPKDAAWSPPDTGGQPPTPEVLEQSCEVMAREFKSSRVRSPEDARVMLDEMIKSPPPIPKAQFEWCRDQISRMIDTATVKMRDAEGKNALGQIAKDMITAYEREQMSTPGSKGVVRKLCPSAKPVPTKLGESGVKYQSTPADWSKDPGWSCLKFSFDQPQLFQYEVKTVPGKGFVAYARRKDGKDVLELSIHGDIKKDVVEMAPTIDEKRTPAK